jgi:acetyl-CoA carboxylase, biotin carboxylase subunit
VVRRAEELAALFEQASAEAREAFGDGRLFLERFLENARHVEVQVLGDRHRDVVHLFERDCSLQRRHQKVVEEAPAPNLADRTRRDLLEAATAFAKAIDYDSAGTVEFLVDGERFYFLEMNTRIQVEHPVTEAVTGVDLIAAQIRVAAGEQLAFAQADVAARGHAIECRVNVEDPDRDFLPSPGRITEWQPPEGDGIRVDSHGFAGYRVPPHYDSLLAKVIGHGADRAEAIARTSAAIGRFAIGGVKTNLAFHRFVLGHPDFAAARVSTRWIESVGLAEYHRQRRLAS